MKIDSDTRTRVIELYKEGVIRAEIARQLDITPSKVYAIVQAADLPPQAFKQGRKKKYSNRDAVKVHNLRDQGFTIGFIANQLNLSRQAVYYLNSIKLVNGSSRITPSANQQRDRKICDRRATGETYESIAQCYGLTRQRIEQIAGAVEVPDVQPVRSCGMCSIEFNPRDRGGSRFCSNTCGRRSISVRNRNPDAKWSRVGKKKFRCVGCGVKFERENYLLAQAERTFKMRGYGQVKNKYCTNKCYLTYNHFGQAVRPKSLLSRFSNWMCSFFSLSA
jgi:DNA-binding CsgD family transcriptional regulator